MTPSTAWHRLSDVDTVRKVATCSVCGPNAPVYFRLNRSRTCMIQRRAAKAKSQRTAGRQKRYGLPRAVAQLIEMQGGACAICGGGITPETAAVDHDHACCPARRTSCGECVRGLLCGGCNLGLGYFRDDQSRLASAIAYLGAPPGVR